MIGAIIDRLVAAAMPPFIAIEGAEALEALAAGTKPRHGTCFVLPYDEAGEPNTRSTGAHSQRVQVEFLTAVVIRQYDDAKGGKRISAVDQFRDATEDALAGWTPDVERHAPINFVASRSAPAGNGVVWFVTTWSTDRYIRKVS
ncbi:hypothetical protein D3874_03035 [Oleomonas cavernae]|uniref:DUF3168 domain-containing protein n=1 Tax=Oleomonas cavernae TaxID=2320859 RepID=A0A418WU92_9PROT|nr:hypothetical protein [Oleomonas cavernae]RJF94805.1 hypothetical protein D3874_03035 [Oleomonas cavernae]